MRIHDRRERRDDTDWNSKHGASRAAYGGRQRAGLDCAAGDVPDRDAAHQLELALRNAIFVDPVDINEILDGITDGDEFGLILEATPKDTGSTHGHAAWMTFYAPAGTVIIGTALPLFPSRPFSGTLLK